MVRGWWPGELLASTRPPKKPLAGGDLPAEASHWHGDKRREGNPGSGMVEIINLNGCYPQTEMTPQKKRFCQLGIFKSSNGMQIG